MIFMSSFFIVTHFYYQLMIKEWAIMNFSLGSRGVHPWGNTNPHRIRTQKLPVKSLIHISPWFLMKNLHRSRGSAHIEQWLSDMLICNTAIIGVLHMEPIWKTPYCALSMKIIQAKYGKAILLEKISSDIMQIMPLSSNQQPSK